MTDLEMLRAVCEKTRAIQLINLTDCPLACAIQNRLDETKPAARPHVESGCVLETNQSMVNRLPDPVASELNSEEVEKARIDQYRRFQYAHV